MTKNALITGISGQDGSYMAELLLSKGYEVHGHTRHAAGHLGNSQHLIDLVTVHRFDYRDRTAWDRLFADLQPNEVYHFAADSFVPTSWDAPVANQEANAGFPLWLLEAMQKRSPETRLLNACSREIFGHCDMTFVNEQTPMNPSSLYGVNKAASRLTIHAYRDHYGLFANNAILFNHESPRRGKAFVTRKITSRVAEIVHGLASDLQLGSLGTERDWGYAGDFVEGMWLSLQLDEPEDFIFGTGVLHTIQDFVEMSFSTANLNWRQYVHSEFSLVRHNEARAVAADITKAQRLLSWKPRVQVDELAEMMVHSDIDALRTQVVRRAA